MKKIVVGFENRLSGRGAVRHAELIAKRWQAEVLVVHSRPAADPPPTHSVLVPNAENWHSGFNRLVAQGLDDAHKFADELRENGVKVSVETKSDYPDTAVIKAMEETGCDLVVVGWPRAETPTARASSKAAERVARTCKKPVLVARGLPDVRDTDDGYNHIVVPTDFSKTAEDALIFALSVAADEARIEVVHFWQPTGSLGPYFDAPIVADFRSEKLEAQLAKNARILGDKLLKKHPSERVTVTFSEVAARPVDGILAHARSKSPSLIVMGTHGRRGWRRMFMGSVAEDTIGDATCSVLVVPPQGDY